MWGKQNLQQISVPILTADKQKYHIHRFNPKNVYETLYQDNIFSNLTQNFHKIHDRYIKEC